jgi:hypothetical protein
VPNTGEWVKDKERCVLEFCGYPPLPRTDSLPPHANKSADHRYYEHEAKSDQQRLGRLQHLGEPHV